MIIPQEFDYLTQAFWQGSDREYDSQEEWINSRLEYLRREQKVVVRKFLDDLLDRKASDEELVDAWKSGSSCYWIGAAGARQFFEYMRKRLAEAE